MAMETNGQKLVDIGLHLSRKSNTIHPASQTTKVTVGGSSSQQTYYC